MQPDTEQQFVAMLNKLPRREPEKSCQGRGQDPIIKQVSSVFDEAQLILHERAEQYQGNQVEDYMPFGATSFVQMTHLKSMRLVSIVKEGLPLDKLEDSALDLINYAAFLVAYIRLQRGETNE
jgi:hypothetical protein